jgi:hypothetical protein
MGLSGATIETYRPQYRPLSAIRYLDANLLPTRYMLFITLLADKITLTYSWFTTSAVVPINRLYGFKNIEEYNFIETSRLYIRFRENINSENNLL